MSEEIGSFLSRWSRRKAEHRSEQEASTPSEAAGPDNATATPTQDQGSTSPLSDVQGPQIHHPQRPDPEPRSRESAVQSNGATDLEARTSAPELPDIESLTPESDFSAFMQPGVDPQAQSAALKRLFIDAHFNRIDEMDIDIADFGIFEPISPAMLRSMNQARSLGFFSDEQTEEPAPAEAGESMTGETEESLKDHREVVAESAAEASALPQDPANEPSREAAMRDREVPAVQSGTPIAQKGLTPDEPTSST